MAGSAFLIAATGPSGSAPRVLFVCLHGTVKSPIARELMRARAGERGIAVDVRSRGIDPEEGATPEVAAALVRDRIDVSRDPLLPLTSADGEWADIVVYFDPLPLAMTGPDMLDWSDTPSVNARYDEAIAVLRARVESLLDTLAAKR